MVRRWQLRDQAALLLSRRFVIKASHLKGCMSNNTTNPFVPELTYTPFEGYFLFVRWIA